jgi:hypothetical protein
MKPISGEFPEFPAPPKNFPAPARKIPAAGEKNSLLCTAGNLLQVTGNAASTHSETADSAPNPKKFSAKFPATGNSNTKADWGAPLL